MKKEHKEILELISEYLKKPNSDYLRFGQVLFNLDINQFVDNNPELSKYYIRDIYNDSDKKS